MGIGAYECSLYVQELGGAIQVDSALGAGTTMTIRLPLMESLTPSEASA
jgi:chemotaxis protein histidine kinase CheA